MTALADLPAWPGFPPHRYLIDSDGDYQGDPDGPHMCASQANALITALSARLELTIDALGYMQTLLDSTGQYDAAKWVAGRIAACREPAK